MPHEDTTGFYAMPGRYATDSGREVIDIIRDSMSDGEFAAFCRGTALKYHLREGKKGPGDADKRTWYELMAEHVLDPTRKPDPRHRRPEFEPYRQSGRKGNPICAGIGGYSCISWQREGACPHVDAVDWLRRQPTKDECHTASVRHQLRSID